MSDVIDPNLIQRHLNQLAEHFDTVHIFVTKHIGEHDVTQNTDAGIGNYYARFGQIIQWVNTQDNNEYTYDPDDDDDPEPTEA